jgi:hypothetical protein
MLRTEPLDLLVTSLALYIIKFIYVIGMGAE